MLAGRLSLGTMLAANTLAMSVLAPLQTFVGTIQVFSVLRAQVERIYDVLDAPAEASGRNPAADQPDRHLPPGRPLWTDRHRASRKRQ